MERMREGKAGRVNPLLVPRMISNMAAGQYFYSTGTAWKMYQCGRQPVPPEPTVSEMPSGPFNMEMQR